MLPEEVASHPLVRGVRGAPNRWPIPEDIHFLIHKGPGGGAYNIRWKEEIAKLGEMESVTVQGIAALRIRLTDEFHLSEFQP